MRSKAQEDYTSARVLCSEVSATIGDLGTYDNKACCFLFKCAREFFSVKLCAAIYKVLKGNSKSKTRWHKMGLCTLKQHIQLSGERLMATTVDAQARDGLAHRK